MTTSTSALQSQKASYRRDASSFSSASHSSVVAVRQPPLQSSTSMGTATSSGENTSVLTDEKSQYRSAPMTAGAGGHSESHREEEKEEAKKEKKSMKSKDKKKKKKKKKSSTSHEAPPTSRATGEATRTTTGQEQTTPVAAQPRRSESSHVAVARTTPPTNDMVDNGDEEEAIPTAACVLATPSGLVAAAEAAAVNQSHDEPDTEAPATGREEDEVDLYRDEHDDDEEAPRRTRQRSSVNHNNHKLSPEEQDEDETFFSCALQSLVICLAGTMILVVVMVAIVVGVVVVVGKKDDSGTTNDSNSNTLVPGTQACELDPGCRLQEDHEWPDDGGEDNNNDNGNDSPITPGNDPFLEDTVIALDTFENDDLGIWNLGGKYSHVYTGDNAVDGIAALRIEYGNLNNGNPTVSDQQASSVYTNPIDVTGLTQLRVTFDYIASNGFENGDAFMLESSPSLSGSNTDAIWTVQQVFSFGQDWSSSSNDHAGQVMFAIPVTIATISNNMLVLRFRCFAGNPLQKIFLDNIQVEGF